MASVDQIQGLSGTLAIKPPCRVATTAAITLSGEQTIDGVAVVADDRVLVKDQSTASENGIWIADTSAWSRALDFDGGNDVVDGTLVYVANGTTNADLVFRCTGTNPIIAGTTSITFTGSVTFTTMSAFAATLLDDADAAAARATLGAIGAAGANLTGGINSARGNITQHATTMDFFAVTSPDILDGTGSAVTITACVDAPQAGATRKFYPIVATVLTHGATFDIAGNEDLTAAAGDCWIIEAKTVSTYRVTAVKEDGTPVIAPGASGNVLTSNGTVWVSTALGGATSSFATGMGMALHGATVPSGWILADGRTIGSAASGATNRANADCANLYAEFWNSYANTELAVSSGRGANAAADFAANKTIAVPDIRSRVVAGKDDMGGTTASRLTSGGSGITGTTLGASGGTETHTLTTAQLASHSHTMGVGLSLAGGAFVNTYSGDSSAGGAQSTVAAGSGNAHQNTQPTHIANWIIKL